MCILDHFCACRSYEHSRKFFFSPSFSGRDAKSASFSMKILSSSSVHVLARHRNHSSCPPPPRLQCHHESVFHWPLGEPGGGARRKRRDVGPGRKEAQAKQAKLHLLRIGYKPVGIPKSVSGPLLLRHKHARHHWRRRAHKSEGGTDTSYWCPLSACAQTLDRQQPSDQTLKWRSISYSATGITTIMEGRRGGGVMRSDEVCGEGVAEV